jgi:hypothetical protein
VTTNTPIRERPGCLIAIAGAVLVLLLGFGWVWHLTVGRGAAIAERVTDPDRLLATYDGYYDRCTAIVAYDHNIIDATKAYDDAQHQAATGDPLGLKAQDVQQARTNLQGLVQRRRELAEQYNADSLKITNLNGLTKGDDLPERIEDGQTPTCGHNHVETGS